MPHYKYKNKISLTVLCEVNFKVDGKSAYSCKKQKRIDTK